MRVRQAAPISKRTRISFREALTQFDALSAEVAATAGHLPVEDRAHLARWANDDRAEGIWEKVQQLAHEPVGSFDPLQGLIAAVLSARLAAEIAKPTHEILRRHRERSARYLELAKQLEALAQTWRRMANRDNLRSEFALKKAKAHGLEARAWRKLAEKAAPPTRFSVSRSDRAGSRKQRVFMQLVSYFLINLCGRPLDSEVAALNDIAFDTPEATSVQQVRSARRPTTRQGRSHRRSKRSRSL